MSFEKFFGPKSVAVIGASNDKRKVGYSLVFNLKNGGKRRVFPVSLNEKVVLSLPAYRSISDIKERIDLALIAIPAAAVPGVLKECGEKAVPAVIVISSGFKEAGAAGKELEAQIRMIAANYHIALLGPNCLGTIDAHAGLNASFSVAEMPAAGSIAVLSQSGAMGAAMLDWAREEGVGLSKFVSLGNEASLTELEFLKYLGNDRATKGILLYLEKVSDGPRFIALTKKISRKKPIVILKAGRSARGSAAAMSHTGSLAPASAVFDAACREGGVTTVGSLRELYNMAKLFQAGVGRPPRRIAVLTNGGGPSVVAADLVELSSSLSLVQFGDGTKRALTRVLPPMAAVGNPVDILGDALAPRYEAALKILAREKAVDAIILILTPQMMTDAEGVAALVAAYKKKKLILPVFMGRRAVAKGVAALRAKGLPNFNYPGDAIAALNARAMAACGEKSATTKPVKTAPNAAKLVDFLPARELLSKYGIRHVGELVRTKSELGDALKKLGGKPAAMKVVSADISHKTDVGGVRLDIKDAAEARGAWEEMEKAIRRRAPGAAIKGMLVQPMTRGTEIIVGMKRDPVFGPVITFGLGGIFVEIMKDVSLRVAPVDADMARTMMDEIKGAPLLRGARGAKPVDLRALAKLITSLSRLALVHPEISAVDLNPVIANETGATVVDARVVAV